tara:strand:- start:183 stop:323 length:141 start_codon:yes stop_codon:yes gene_type:complete
LAKLPVFQPLKNNYIPAWKNNRNNPGFNKKSMTSLNRQIFGAPDNP